MKKTYAVFSVVFVLLISGCVQQAGETMNETENQSLQFDDVWKSCQTDSDCMETQAGCCSCRNGGTQTAINKVYLNLWEEQISEKCQGIFCITMYACQEGKAVCDAGQCRFLAVQEACVELCEAAKAEGMVLSDGPCLSDNNPEWGIENWVCDVAHSPRQSVDNQPENQCQEFRSGKASHFVEVDTDCGFIRAV